MGKEQLGNTKLVLRFEPLIVQKCNCAICGKKLRWKITIFQKVVFAQHFFKGRKTKKFQKQKSQKNFFRI